MRGLGFPVYWSPRDLTYRMGWVGSDAHVKTYNGMTPHRSGLRHSAYNQIIATMNESINAQNP